MKIETTYKKIGTNEPIFLIAEAGVNHNGDVKVAHKLIDAAADAGADAVKFQTFLVAESVLPSAPLAPHHISNLKDSISHYDLLKRLELPLNAFQELKAHCEARDVVFISTPYDIPSAEYLIDIKCEMIKIASSEMINFPLLQVVGMSGIPIILSTGMSTWEEIAESISFLKGYHSQLCILKCTSSYPAKFDSINLRGILRLRECFDDCLVGFSDHTIGDEIGTAAVGLGACVIEKHFTLNKELWGPDHCASMMPAEFATFVERIRNVEKALGEKEWQIGKEEKVQRRCMQKGVYARNTIRKGETLNINRVMFLRPSGQITPKDFVLHLEGRTVKKQINQGEEIGIEAIEC